MKENDLKHARERAKHLLKNNSGKPSMYINDISKLFDGRISDACEGKGVSRGYRSILRSLSRNDGLTQLELVKEGHLSAPSVSVALTKMEQSGLVRRSIDPDDCRKVRVFLTDKGREHDVFIKKLCHEADEIMLRGFSAEEEDQLNGYLRRILENMLEEEDNGN